MFGGDAVTVERAYALAGALVSDMLSQRGRGFPAAVVRRVAQGERFERAFEEVAGVPLAVEDWRFLRRQRSRDRWILVLTSSATVWTFVTGLAIAAMVKRRRRDALIRRLWDAEEAARGLRAEESPVPPAPPEGPVN